MSGMTDGPKKCRDVTEGIIIMPAVTHCYLFTSLTEKRRFISRHYSVYLRTDEIFRLSQNEKKSRSLSLDAFIARFRFRSQVYMDHTVLPAITPLPRKHSPDGASPD